MKMRPGPKAILMLILVGALVGFGFWAGRGFPQTWEGVFQKQALAAAPPTLGAPRMDSLEARVTALEQEVRSLNEEVRAARQLAPTPIAPRPLSTEPQSDGPTLPTPGRQDNSADTGVEYR